LLLLAGASRVVGLVRAGGVVVVVARHPGSEEMVCWWWCRGVMLCPAVVSGR